MKQRLFAPGPVEVSVNHYKETLDLSLNHRTPEFSELMRELVTLLKYSFDSTGEMFVFTSSGSGGMECSVANLFSPEEKVLVVNTGTFGARFLEIAKVHRLKTVELKPAEGNAVSSEEIEKILNEQSDIKGVLVQFVDTSTGIRNDIKKIGKITSNRDVMLVVDGVSGLIANEYSHDKYKVDASISASQKGFESPPGLSFLTFSKRAMDRINKREDIGTFYFGIKKMKKFMDESCQTPFTPAINLIKPLISKIREIKEDGLEKNVEKHRVVAESIRAGIIAIGLEIFTEENSRCDTLTPVRIPEGISAKNIQTKMRDEYGYIIAGGQGELAGKIIRLGHIGNIDIFDSLGMFGALEISLKEEGLEFETGIGVKAILNKYMEIK